MIYQKFLIMENPKIHIELIEQDGAHACVTTTYGSVIDLALVLSSMLSNQRFAEVIMIASSEYTKENTPKEAYLN